jgi:hypothetical protein
MITKRGVNENTDERSLIKLNHTHSMQVLWGGDLEVFEILVSK